MGNIIEFRTKDQRDLLILIREQEKAILYYNYLIDKHHQKLSLGGNLTEEEAEEMVMSLSAMSHLQEQMDEILDRMGYQPIVTREDFGDTLNDIKKYACEIGILDECE